MCGCGMWSLKAPLGHRGQTSHLGGVSWDRASTRTGLEWDWLLWGGGGRESGLCLPESHGTLCLRCVVLYSSCRPSYSLGHYQTPSLPGSLLELSQADLMPTPLGSQGPSRSADMLGHYLLKEGSAPGLSLSFPDYLLAPG